MKECVCRLCADAAVIVLFLFFKHEPPLSLIGFFPASGVLWALSVSVAEAERGRFLVSSRFHFVHHRWNASSVVGFFFFFFFECVQMLSLRVGGPA